MIDLCGFTPETAYVFDHGGQRWWSETHLMLPMPKGFPATFPEPGRYVLNDQDRPDYWQDKWEPEPRTIAITEPIERNVDRGKQRLLAGLVDTFGRACVYLNLDGHFVNRIYVDIAEQLVERRVIGFGTKYGPTPVTMYSDTDVVGFIMPVRINSLDELIDLGVES